MTQTRLLPLGMNVKSKEMEQYFFLKNSKYI